MSGCPFAPGTGRYRRRLAAESRERHSKALSRIGLRRRSEYFNRSSRLGDGHLHPTRPMTTRWLLV